MTGPSSTEKQAEQMQLQTSQQQLALESQYAQYAQGRLAQGDALQQPLINRDKALVSGDPNTVLQAAGPGVGQFAKAGQASKDQIYNNLPPGAARDFAQAQSTMNTNTQTAGYINNLVNAAPGELAQIGTGQYSVGLTQAGQGQTSGQISNTAAGQVGQLEQQSKASTLGFLGSLAGAAGKAAGGFSFGGGGSAPTPTPESNLQMGISQPANIDFLTGYGSH